LDYALGVGGVPRGRIVEIFGPESSGKTTLCLQIAAQVHKLGGNVAFIDAEHGLDLKYAKNLGVNVDDLILSQPDNGEQALGIAEEWLKSGAMDLIIIDSVAALTPLSELEGEMGAPTMGVQARLMSQACRKLAAIIGKTNTIVIFTNQLRMKIGVMFGNPEVTTGGNALKFYSSVRLDVRRQDAIKVGEEIIGNKTRIKVVKNKVAPPFRETTVNVIYGAGIDVYNDLVSLGVFTGIIDKSGSWFAYRGDRLGQGADNAATFLKENPSIFTLLRADIIIKLFT
jgi:recombination protein RecA